MTFCNEPQISSLSHPGHPTCSSCFTHRACWNGNIWTPLSRQTLFILQNEPYMKFESSLSSHLQVILKARQAARGLFQCLKAAGILTSQCHAARLSHSDQKPGASTILVRPHQQGSAEFKKRGGLSAYEFDKGFHFLGLGQSVLRMDLRIYLLHPT